MTTVTVRCNWPNGIVIADPAYPFTQVTLPFGTTSNVDSGLWSRWANGVDLGAGGSVTGAVGNLAGGAPGSLIASGAVQYVSSP
jgi:hypothetical protein